MFAARSARCRRPAAHSRIGPASTRIILEVLEHGFSPTVERAIVESGQQHEITRRRALRTGFLSRAEVVRLLAVDVPDIVDVNDYRGDYQMHSVWRRWGRDDRPDGRGRHGARLGPNRG